MNTLVHSPQHFPQFIERGAVSVALCNADLSQEQKYQQTKRHVIILFPLPPQLACVTLTTLCTRTELYTL